MTGLESRIEYSLIHKDNQTKKFVFNRLFIPITLNMLSKFCAGKTVQFKA